MSETITVRTTTPIEITDITEDVESSVTHVQTGICHVYVPHTTAGIAINEAETRLLDDLERLLRDLVTDSRTYRHDEIDDNAVAHLRTLLLDSSVSIPIADGELALGTWQRILLFEGDGPRSRRVRVTVVG